MMQLTGGIIVIIAFAAIIRKYETRTVLLVAGATYVFHRRRNGPIHGFVCQNHDSRFLSPNYLYRNGLCFRYEAYGM